MNALGYRGIAFGTLAVCASMATPLRAGDEPIAVTLLAKVGDVIDGSTVTDVLGPTVSPDDKVAFILRLTEQRHAIWYDDGVFFLSDDAPIALALPYSDATVNFDSAGEFVYATRVGDPPRRAIYSSLNGAMSAECDQAPGFPPGVVIWSPEFPQMMDDGSIYWHARYDQSGLCVSGDARFVLYHRPVAGPITAIVQDGDMIDGDQLNGDPFQITRSILSDNGSNMLLRFEEFGFPLGEDERIAVNGQVVASAGSATGSGDNWQYFGYEYAINNDGDYLFFGTTDGSITTRKFLAYDAQIILRVNQVLGDNVLALDVRDVDINNHNQAAFVWGYRNPASHEAIFFAPDASDIPGSSIVLLSQGDLIDTDGNGEGDWIIDTIFDNPYGDVTHLIELAENGMIYAHVELRSLDGSAHNLDAIVAIPLPASSCNPADLAEPFGALDFSDVTAFLVAFAGSQPEADLAAPFGSFDFSDVVAFLTAFGSGCP
ncbi:MAG: GC-type dockerin domain-anchored protein [Phycisphaerales bacterium]